MIERLGRAEDLGLFLRVRPNYAHARRRERRRRDRVRDVVDISRPTSSSTAVSSCFEPGVLRTRSSPGDELVDQPFRAADRARRLLAYQYDGFWAPMDTLKDKQRLESLWRAAAHRGGSTPLGSTAPHERTVPWTASTRTRSRDRLSCRRHRDRLRRHPADAARTARPTCASRGSCSPRPGDRAGEAAASARAFLSGAHESNVIVESFRDGFLPYLGTAVKEFFDS